ncbi:Endocuticle structural glycoprotein SgAbd-3 [Papilio xuthus]|uniref:Endocuticle structural glycoprotein SgAbd-3 n=1 Tax=Papilio xuthus TaxID=66420 RepID=A0A194Q3C6_PAPXU|nr:Endocuticle structural glycoprotein SgAbd-3 [Papilio xuthus]
MLLRSNLVLIFTVITISLLCEHAQGKRGRYRYNHPPSIESTENVPVAVIYDSDDIREDKSIKLSANFQTSKDDLITPENIKQNSDTTPEINADVPKQVKRVEQKKNQSNSLTTDKERSLQIPVSVVYDSEPSNKENVPSTSAPIVRRRPTGRRLPKSDSYRKPKDNIVTDKQIEEKSIVNSDTSLIPTATTESSLNTPVKDQGQVKIVKRKRTRGPVVPIVTERNFVYAHSGNFHYSFEGGDGTKVFEDGSLKSINDETGEAVSGGFSYKDKDGNDISLSYTADENGYRPIGAHLPTPPPIPPEIARALAYLATKSTPQPITEPTKKFD